MQEPCPFCSKPIIREYGSFRCKNCARSSEDQLDLARKTRAAELRKEARAREKASVAEEQAAKSRRDDAKLRAVALAVARHAARKRSDDDAPAEVAVPAAPLSGTRTAPARRRAKRARD